MSNKNVHSFIYVRQFSFKILPKIVKFCYPHYLNYSQFINLHKNIFMKAGKVWKYPIKAAVFDVDGTILDSIKNYYQANKIMSGDPNFPFSLQQKLNRFSGKDVAKEVIKQYHLKMTPEEYLQKRLRILSKLLPSSSLIPGIERIVRTIHDMGIPMAIGTSAWSCNHKSKICKLQKFFSLFTVTICGDEVREVKPSPEIFQVAASKLGDFSPENVLVFEDAANGIKAANSAGMPCILLSDGSSALMDDLYEYDCQPTLII